MTAVPITVACGLAGLLAVGMADLVSKALVADRPLLVINESASLPRGIYVRAPGATLRRGALVVTPPPAAARAYLDELGVDGEARLLKRLAAVPGDRVCAREDSVVAGGRRVPVFALDRAGRPLPRWRGCRRLRPGEVFLLGETPQSFDSRYFGPVPVSRVVGIYRETLTW